MNEDLMKRMDEARDQVLRSQRQCAWCTFKAQDSDDLVRHIEEHHPKDEKGIRS